MISSPMLPIYEDINDIFLRVSDEVSAAQAHGLLSAFVCCGEANPQFWEGVSFEELESGDVIGKEAQARLKELQSITQQQLESLDYDFQLLLPDDDESQAVRAESLGDWCYGFIGGLGLAGVSDEEIESADIKEILGSFSQIANIDHSGLEEDEDSEKELTELMEYVRMAVIYIYQDFSDARINQLGSLGGASKHLH